MKFIRVWFDFILLGRIWNRCISNLFVRRIEVMSRGVYLGWSIWCVSFMWWWVYGFFLRRFVCRGFVKRWRRLWRRYNIRWGLWIGWVWLISIRFRVLKIFFWWFILERIVWRVMWGVWDDVGRWGRSCVVYGFWLFC